MAHPLLKRTERAGKRVVFRAAARMLRGPSRGAAPDWDARRFRVLYLRYDRIGDMIMATGLIREIARSHATIDLDVLASPSNAAVLEGNPYVRRVVMFDRRRTSALPSTLRALRGAHYDVVIDGMVLTPSVTTMLLMLATGARYRIGISGRTNDFVYTLPVPPAPADAHVIEQAGQTAIPFGVNPARANWRPELFLREDELARAEAVWGPRRGARLLINVSAFVAHHRWAARNFVAVIQVLRRAHADAGVLVIGAPGDREMAAWIAAEARAKLARTAAVRDAFALVATADVVFTPDTSIAHAAAAAGTPVAVMVRAGARTFIPYGSRHVLAESDGRTLADLPVWRAALAIDQLLLERRAR